MPSHNLLIFTDQSQDPALFLKSILKTPSNAGLLYPFLQASVSALKQEAERLLGPANEQTIGAWNSIAGLIAWQEQAKETNVVVSTVLLCLAQLASLLINVEHHPGLLEDTHRDYLLGLCTGFLPAVVAATCTSKEDVIEFGGHIACVALRLGVEVDRRSRLVENSSASWSTAVRGVSAGELQAILDRFNREKRIPRHRQTYISAGASTSATISGPPSTIQQLFAHSQRLAETQKASLHIQGAFHAGHLGLPDVNLIIAPAAADDRNLRANAFIISPSSGEPYIDRSVASVLSQGLRDILQTPISQQNIIYQTAPQLKECPTKLLVVGPKWGTSGICQALTSQGVSLLRDQFSIESGKEPEPIAEKDGIAIIAMSGRFPGGGSLEEFWASLEQGKDLHTQIPSTRFDASKYFDPYGDRTGQNRCPYGCFIDEVGDFDTQLFSMSPREAKQTDPTQRLLMMATYEALEMAGYSQSYGGTVGTYFGQTTDDWREANAGQNPDLYYVPGTMRAFGPGRLNYFFKWDGPSYSIDTACSSSLAAVEMACNALRLGDCDMAVAGGGNVLTGPNMFRGLSNGGFLSPTGSCKTFDDQADGYCRGEAVGVVILKPLHKAITDNDNIYGTIRGIATNHSAHAISITHPHQGAQEELFNTVLRKAEVSPSSVDYVELHGTGTQAGDSIEVASVASILGNCSGLDKPLYIGSVKANMGHGEAGAGITSLIKTLMMFQKNRIPPHAGIKGQINHKFGHLTERNIHIANSSLPFNSRSDQQQRRILVNNFNATGGNTSLLLEEYATTSKVEKSAESYYPVVISAKTLNSLLKSKARMLSYLQENARSVSLSNLSYTTTSRRLHHNYRISYSAANLEDLVRQMTQDTSSPQKAGIPSNIVFTFVGQGVNHRGIAKQIFDTCPFFRNRVACYNWIAMGLGFPSFLEHMTSDDEGSTSSPVVEQLSLVALEIAMAELWKNWGVRPSMVVGHSLGEYSALCVAGVLSVSDTLFLVGKRAELMQSMCSENTHAMLAISLPLSSAQGYCASLTSCEISCINGPTAIVISGLQEDVKELQSKLAAQNIQAKYLALPYAFHSSQMDPILASLREVTKSVLFSRPAIPFLSSMMGKVIDAGTPFESEYPVRHARQPVNLLGAVESLQQDNKFAWLECGPGSGCLSMIKASINAPPTKFIVSLKKGVDGWKTMTAALAAFYSDGHAIRWSVVHQVSEPDLRLLELPPYAFDTQNHYIEIEDSAVGETSKMHENRKPLSTSVQYVEEENCQGHGDATVKFLSDPKQEQLLAAIEGHCVQGSNLCPSSVYVDMAVTSARYLYSNKNNIDAITAIELTDIEIFHPLVVSSNGPDMQVTIQPALSQGSDTVRVAIGSQKANKCHESHSTCKVRFDGYDQWVREWSRYSDLISSRMQQLASVERNQDICRIPGKVLYRMFASIVDYDEKYHSISDIFIDTDRNEACGTIDLPAASEYGEFTCSPYSIDGIVHFAGFLLNNNLGKVKDTAYVSSGWESLRLLPDRFTAKPYRIYSRMQESKKKGLWLGDVYLLDGDEIVATCFGLKFQQIKVSLLHRLLGGSLAADHSHQAHRPKTSGHRDQEAIIASHLVPESRSTGPIDVFPSVAKIIADEVGMNVSEIPEDAHFEDLGIDSLLSVSITSSISGGVGIPLPTSVFDGDSTLSQVRTYLQREFKSSPNSTTSSSGNILTPVSSAPSTVESSEFQVLLNAVVDETGCNPFDLEPDTLFEELGVDSLLSMAVLATSQKMTGRGLPSSVFSDYPTVKLMREMLESLAAEPSQSHDTRTGSEPWPNYSNFGRLLQGSLSSGLPSLFLTAPGSGYPGSYINLPKFARGLPVYTLESPFLQYLPPGGWSIERAASLYVKEIRRLQPRGPYILGGWSIGGMYSYEIARQLLSEEDEVLGIIMIDSPCPEGMPKMPTPTVGAVEITGLYAPIVREGLPDIDMPMSLKEHTVGSLKALKNYRPAPMDPARRPCLVVQIWASKGQYDKLPEKVAEATQLLTAQKNGTLAPGQPLSVSKDWQSQPRSSFGPCGWDRLVGDDLICHVVDGDHESIMSPPQIDITGQLMQDAIEKILPNS